MMEGGCHLAALTGHHVHGPAGHRRHRSAPGPPEQQLREPLSLL